MEIIAKTKNGVLIKATNQEIQAIITPEEITINKLLIWVGLKEKQLELNGLTKY